MHQNHSYSLPVTTVSSGDARLMSVLSSHIDLIGQEESEGQQRHGNRYAQANGREGGQSEEPGEQEQRKDSRDLAPPLIPADSHL